MLRNIIKLNAWNKMKVTYGTFLALLILEEDICRGFISTRMNMTLLQGSFEKLSSGMGNKLLHQGVDNHLIEIGFRISG